MGIVILNGKSFHKFKPERCFYIPEVNLFSLLLCFSCFVYDYRSQQSFRAKLFGSGVDTIYQIPVLIKGSEIRFRDHDQAVGQSTNVRALKGESTPCINNNVVIMTPLFFEKLKQA